MTSNDQIDTKTTTKETQGGSVNGFHPCLASSYLGISFHCCSSFVPTDAFRLFPGCLDAKIVPKPPPKRNHTARKRRRVKEATKK
eukprot:2548280-Amphidinium_carterae.1